MNDFPSAAPAQGSALLLSPTFPSLHAGGGRDALQGPSEPSRHPGRGGCGAAGHASCRQPRGDVSWLLTLARLLSRSGRFMSVTVMEGLKSCRGERAISGGGRKPTQARWGDSWWELPRSICCQDLVPGRMGGRTHVQQRARVHAEAVGGQHRLEVVQVGVDGVQVVIELVPARKKEERG